MKYRVVVPITGFIDIDVDALNGHEAIQKVVSMHPKDAQFLCTDLVWQMQESMTTEDGDSLVMLEDATATEVIA